MDHTEGQVTKAGVLFARCLISLGVRGNFELVPTPPKPKRSSKPVSKKIKPPVST